MKGLDKACERIHQAICEKEQIVIYGDYDVDGVTSTSILFLFLRELGVPASHLHFFIPHRIEHGYGLQASCLPEVKKLGCDLMITVDCGISNRKEVGLATELGIETIIIDHHLTPPELPEAFAILNPHQEGCLYPDKELAAVGVTFNLMIGLRAFLREKGFFKKQKEPNLKKFTDLVALGTVADVVPLRGVNRIFVRTGLSQMEKSCWVGLNALMNVSDMTEGNYKASQLGFQVGPRINAVGRMHKASVGVDLLCTKNPKLAEKLALDLDHQNELRRSNERQTHREAREIIKSSPEFLNAPAIVLAKEGWHPGVIGIVASRLVEEYHRPVFMLALSGDKGKGSGRSISSFHLYKALGECQKELIQFGGHAMAAGLTMDSDKVDAFRERLCEIASERLKPIDLQPIVHYDAVFDPGYLTENLVNEMGRLEPYGMGNPAPVLLGESLQVCRQKLVGSDQDHLQCQFRTVNGQILKGIAFSHKKYYPLPEHTTIAYRPQINSWKGRRSVELHIKKVQSTPQDEL